MKESVVLLPEDYRIDPSRPLYEQFVTQIRARIVSGQIAAGARMPSVRDLAATMRVNPTTAARTYQELERMGLIVTHRGQGTYVTYELSIIHEARLNIAREAVNQLKETAKSIGMTIQELISFTELGGGSNGQ